MYTGPVTLALNISQKYFGLWWSAADAGNKIEFFKGGTSLYSFDTTALVSYVTSNPGYLGNPNPGVPSVNEYFAFVNFFAGTGTDFDRIVFTNSSAISFFESDNHTIAETFNNTPGDPLVVPTPALLPGLIGMGVAAWRKRKAEAAESEV
ncbi:MAG: PTPA-CTERM sorting domain-containing protein [Leptolyngbyaceae cyanobacterium]